MTRYTAKAHFFDKMVSAWKNTRFTRIEREKLKFILREAGLRRGMVVLEPGCGAGRLTRLLARQVGPKGKVIALDISRKLIAACHQNVKAKNVVIRCGRIESARLPTRSVDVVLCLNAFPHFDDKAAALHVFRKSLNEAGKVVVAHLWARKHINRIHRSAGGPIKHDMLPPPRAIRSLFRRAGFRVEKLVDREDLFMVVARPIENIRVLP